MALPHLHRSDGQWRKRTEAKMRERKTNFAGRHLNLSDDEETDEQPSESVRKALSWKLTDSQDNPTRRSAWQLFQESVSDSYGKPLRTIARTGDMNDILSIQGPRQRSRNAVYHSQFSHLNSSSDVNAKYRREHSPFTDHRPLSPHKRYAKFYRKPYDAEDVPSDDEPGEERTWAAPTGSYLTKSGSRTKTTYPSRSRSLQSTTDSLPLFGKTRGRFYDPEDDPTEADLSGISLVSEPLARSGRPHYSRRTFDDPDYYDYDLDSSVEQFKDVFKSARQAVAPTYGPTSFEKKVLTNISSMPGQPMGPYMYRSQASNNPNTPSGNCGFLTATLQTPGYWTKRFEDITTTGNTLYMDKPIPPPTEPIEEQFSD